MRSFVVIAAALTVVGAACSHESERQFCVPNQGVACVGPGPCSGWQVCAADGTRYEGCTCAVDAGADAAQADGGLLDGAGDSPPGDDAGGSTTCETLTRGHVGCEFWAVDLPNEYVCQRPSASQTCSSSYSCAACEQLAVIVVNAGETAAHVTVTQNDAQPGQTPSISTLFERTVDPGGVAQLDLPMREVDCTEWTTDGTGKLRRTTASTSCLSSRAYRITSDHPIAAYQFNPVTAGWSNGASLLLPTNGLDHDYLVLGWPTANPLLVSFPGTVLEGLPDYTNLTIVGVVPGTHVEVTLAHQIQASPTGDIPAGNAGDTITADLGPFDVLNLESRQDQQHLSGDLTGSHVVSNQPVVVFSGGQRAVVPAGAYYSWSPPEPPGGDVCCVEHIEQQVLPTSALGTTYVITRSPARAQATAPPDFYRVLATEAGTTVGTSDPHFPTFALGQGEVAELWSAQDFTLSANQPVAVAQYLAGSSYVTGGGGNGDPDFVLIAPIEQHLRDHAFVVATTFSDNFVVIAAPQDASVALDGVDVDTLIPTTCQKYPAGTVDAVAYGAIRCDVTGGPHAVSASAPVGVVVYSYGSLSSFAYPAGLGLARINPI